MNITQRLIVSLLGEMSKWDVVQSYDHVLVNRGYNTLSFDLRGEVSFGLDEPVPS